MPTAPSGGGGGGGGGGSSGGMGDLSSWLDWFPKVGIFGITLIGVVIWNVRKVAGKQTPRDSLHDFDTDDLFKERLRKNRDERMKKGDGLDDADDKLDKLLAKGKERKLGKKPDGGSASSSAGSSSSSGLGG